MKLRITYSLLIAIVALLATSCDGTKEVKVELAKDGKPLSGVQVTYIEADNRLGSEEYTDRTDGAGKVAFQVTRDEVPLLYYLSAEGENGGEDVASGGFKSGKRVANWVEQGYQIKFKD